MVEGQSLVEQADQNGKIVDIQSNLNCENTNYENIGALSSQNMNDDGSMTDDVKSLGPSKRKKIDKLSFYTIEGEVDDRMSVLSRK